MVFLLYHLDGDNLCESLGTVCNIPWMVANITQHWRIAGLEPTQVVGLLAVAWMIWSPSLLLRGLIKLPRITAVAVLQ